MANVDKKLAERRRRERSDEVVDLKHLWKVGFLKPSTYGVVVGILLIFAMVHLWVTNTWNLKDTISTFVSIVGGALLEFCAIKIFERKKD
jgi:hypothetical protein